MFDSIFSLFGTLRINIRTSNDIPDVCADLVTNSDHPRDFEVTSFFNLLLPPLRRYEFLKLCLVRTLCNHQISFAVHLNDTFPRHPRLTTPPIPLQHPNPQLGRGFLHRR